MSRSSPGFAANPSKVMTIEPHAGEIVVTAGGEIVARSRRALRLGEPPYPPVLYVPFADIDFSKLVKTDRSTHCPYKGDATYWSVVPAGDAGANAMWAYESPYDEAAAIRDHGAFYPDRVTIQDA
jgi:uncharacterized protein (DUF427 family)